MLPNLFTANGPKEKVIFERNGNFIRLEQLQADIALLAAKLALLPPRRLALCYQDSYLFIVAFLAVLQSGSTPVLLPNNLPGTVEFLQAEFADLLTDLPLRLAQQRVGGSDKALPQNVIFFTSGSTGQPKKIVHSLAQITQEVAILEQTFGDRVNDSAIYSTVSHQHLYGLLFFLLWPLTTGRVIHLPQLTSPLSIGDLLMRKGTVTIISSPAILSRMPKVKASNSANTIFSSGGKLTATNITGCYIIDIFGSTETGGVAYRSIADTVWTPLPKVRVQLDAATHCLQITSPHCCDGVFVMGDLAQINADGSFVLLDRSDRIVKIEGKRVSLIEVENILAKHPWVKSVYAIAIKAQREYIGILTVLAEELADTNKSKITAELKKFLRNYFEPTVIPKQFRYVGAIPCNSQGKRVIAEISALFTHPQSTILDPQSLAMDVKYPVIVAEPLIKPAEVTVHIFIPEDLIYFQGHFPNEPILPGVVQVDWAIYFAKRYLLAAQANSAQIGGGIELLKFTKVIRPKAKISLLLQLQNNCNSETGLIFKYFNGDVIYSQGKIKI